MSIPGSFLLVATLMVATGAATVVETREAQAEAVQMQTLRAKAGLASSVGPATFVAADTLRTAAGRASSIGPAVLVLAAR